MEHDEDDLVGQPIEEVPKIDPDDECNARRSDHGTFLGYCNRTSGWGTDGDSGRCRTHNGSGGARDGSGAEEGNTNAVKHGAYADQSTLYSQEFTDAQRREADLIFADYRDRYLDKHDDLPRGHRIRIFKISVNAVTELRVEQWEGEKPSKMDSGVSFIDREEEIKEVGQEGVKHVTFSKSPALAAKKTLSNENRKWLKDLGLLDDPESQKADAIGDLDLSLSAEVKHDLAGAFDAEPET